MVNDNYEKNTITSGQTVRIGPISYEPYVFPNVCDPAVYSPQKSDDNAEKQAKLLDLQIKNLELEIAIKEKELYPLMEVEIKDLEVNTKYYAIAYSFTSNPKNIKMYTVSYSSDNDGSEDLRVFKNKEDAEKLAKKLTNSNYYSVAKVVEVNINGLD